jgi:flagellar protein FliT
VTPDSTTASYSAIWDLTQQMLEAARNSEWNQLAALEQVRSQMAIRVVAKHRENPVPPSEETAETIRKILACDQEIKERTEAWLTELRAILDSVNTERKLFQTYDPGA